MPQPTIAIYGLATCDRTRAARTWLERHGIAYAFHDVREDGLTRPLIEGWIKQLGLEQVLNKASTTWRELSQKDKAGIDKAGADKVGVDEKKVVDLLLRHPTLVKRPVLECAGKLSLGFKPAAYEELFF